MGSNRVNLGITAALLCVAALTSIRDAGAAGPGHAAPSCVLTSADNDHPLLLDQFRGQVVYVDFWASWCAPCGDSFQFLNELDREFQRDGLQIVGINVDQRRDDARAFLRKRPASFIVAFDSGAQCARAFDVQGMPSSYLIDRGGVVRYVHRGFRRSDSAMLRARVASLLAELPTER
jgi:peroxiredoxin